MIRHSLIFAAILAVANAQPNEPTIDEVRELVTRAKEALAEAKATEASLERARQRQKLREYAGAVDDYTKVLQRIPDLEIALVGRGDCLLLLGRPEEALADFRKLEAGVQFKVANASVRVGRSAEAESAISRSVELAPQDARYRRYAGYVQFALGNWERAITELRTSVALPGERNPYAHLTLHLALTRAGRGAESELADVSATWLDPQHRALAGAVLGTLTEDAVLRIARATSIDRERADRMAEATYYLGARHLMLGDREKARLWFERSTHGASKAVIEYAFARYDLERLDRS